MTERALAGQVAASLRALSTEIDRLDQVAADRYGLNRTDMRALDIVGQAGPLAPTALARMLGFTTGGVTSVLDRLERAGYVRRRPVPGDRRRQVVQATEATAARDQEVFGGLIRGTSDLLATYADDQLRVIQDFLDRVRQLTAAYADVLGGEPTKSPGRPLSRWAGDHVPGGAPDDGPPENEAHG
jgi:DNA-binding MarR family transcriptional regulator